VHRVLPPILPLTRELWLISHQDLRQTARIRAFFEFIAEAIRGERFFAATPSS
jgi:DNA-binding transcriptional LysR family regulator